MTGRPLSTKAWRSEGRPSPGFLGEPPPPSPKLPLHSEVVKDQQAVPSRQGRWWSQEQTLVRQMQCLKLGEKWREQQSVWPPLGMGYFPSLCSLACLHCQPMREVPSAVCQPQYTRTVSTLVPQGKSQELEGRLEVPFLPQ